MKADCAGVTNSLNWLLSWLRSTKNWVYIGPYAPLDARREVHSSLHVHSHTL